MTQQGPNPIELYEGAVNYMRPILAGVTPNQLGKRDNLHQVERAAVDHPQH